MATEYLSGRGVAYDEINIRTVAHALRELQRLGVTATPALVIGDIIVVGFDRGKIDDALAALGQQYSYPDD